MSVNDESMHPDDPLDDYNIGTQGHFYGSANELLQSSYIDWTLGVTFFCCEGTQQEFAATDFNTLDDVEGTSTTSTDNEMRHFVNHAGELAVKGCRGLHVVTKSHDPDVTQGHPCTFWDPDGMAVLHEDTIAPDDLLVLVDTDWKLDMTTTLLENVRPVLIYTTMPTRVAGHDEHSKSAFCFKNNKLVLSDGKGKQQHRTVWDYTHNTVRVDTPLSTVPHWAALFIFFALYTVTEEIFFTVTSGMFLWMCMVLFFTRKCRSVDYHIKRKTLRTGKTAVLLTPQASYNGLAAVLATGRPLRSLRPLQVLGENGYNLIRTQRDGEVVVSIARDGAYTAAHVPIVTWDCFEEVYRTSTNVKIDLTRSAIKSHLDRSSGDVHTQLYGYEIDKASMAAIMCSYYRTRALSEGKEECMPFIYPLDCSAINYNYNQVDPFTQPKPGMKPYMSCLIGPPCSPAKTVSNEREAIQARVTDISTPHFQVESDVIRCINDFAEELAPEYRMHPCEVETVFAKQATPGQRRILERADVSGSNFARVFNSFLKAEVYGIGSVKDPRIITTGNGKDKLAFSQFCYRLADVLKGESWYAFGKTPLQVAERVASICEKSQSVVLTDFSRMDGRVNNVSRLLVKAVMLRMFQPQYHDELREQISAHFNKICYMTEDHYRTWVAQNSGAADTSGSNTIVNAFTAYLHFRRQGLGHDLAMQKLRSKGVFGGDDGTLGDADKDILIQSARSLGHVLTLEAHLQRGDSGVSFLSRQFSPEVWQGCPDSCQDINRTVAKFHMCNDLTGTMLSKLVEKAYCVELTDYNTPLLGDYCRRVGELYKNHSSYNGKAKPDTLTEKNTTWFSWWEDASVQFPNNNTQGWMYDYLERSIPGYQLQLLRDFISTATLEDLLKTPCFVKIPEPPTASVNVSLGQENGLEDRPTPIILGWQAYPNWGHWGHENGTDAWLNSTVMSLQDKGTIRQTRRVDGDRIHEYVVDPESADLLEAISTLIKWNVPPEFDPEGVHFVQTYDVKERATGLKERQNTKPKRKKPDKTGKTNGPDKTGRAPKRQPRQQDEQRTTGRSRRALSQQPKQPKSSIRDGPRGRPRLTKLQVELKELERLALLSRGGKERLIVFRVDNPGLFMPEQAGRAPKRQHNSTKVESSSTPNKGRTPGLGLPPEDTGGLRQRGESKFRQRNAVSPQRNNGWLNGSFRARRLGKQRRLEDN